jgi:cysteine desulfurase
MLQRPIYLDCHATTPTDKRVLEAMLPYFCESFGNPASINHAYGWEAEAAVKQARETIAAAINCEPEEIIFTSGATEANNLAIEGVAESHCQKGRHIITCVAEHRAVLDPCQYLESMGFEVTYLPIDVEGTIDLELLAKTIRPDTILVSIMAANNEIGTLAPIAEIGKICHEHNILFHTDAAQAIGKIPLDVKEMSIDLMSLTAHKVYGAKGIGALYVRRRQPRVKIAARIHGGGQERGMRSGTLPTPLIVGFAKAIELALAEMPQESQRLLELRERLQSRLETLDNIYINGSLDRRLAGNLNISFAGVDGAALLLGLQSVAALSSGSACSSTIIAPSHVLKALGRDDRLAYASLRFGIGRFNTEKEIDLVAQQVITTVRALRKTFASF